MKPRQWTFSRTSLQGCQILALHFKHYVLLLAMLKLWYCTEYLTLYFDNSFPGKRASGERFVRVWVNHRADLVSVAKSVAEKNASKWESDKRKKKIFKDCGENIFHRCTRCPLNASNLHAT
jgi:hypothetical protein